MQLADDVILSHSEHPTPARIPGLVDDSRPLSPTRNPTAYLSK
jgi:hypothetical protein